MIIQGFAGDVIFNFPDKIFSIQTKGSRKNNFTFLHLSFSPSLADTSLAPDLIKLASK